MRAALSQTLCMEEWADQKWRHGNVLAITLGESQLAVYSQYFLLLLLYVQAILAARRKATLSVLELEHPWTCRCTQVPSVLLRQANGNDGLGKEGWWQDVCAGLA